MAVAILSDQSSNPSPSPQHPTTGASWPFALLVGDDTVFADSLGELVGFVIPEYGDIPLTDDGAEQALFARVDAGARLVALAQGSILAALAESGEFVPESLSESVLTALFEERGTGASEWDGVWDYEVPLLLLSTDFAPFTGQAPVTGNVQYFDPSDERAFLASLESLGWAQMFVNAEL
jgi:hypothetical protein